VRVEGIQPGNLGRARKVYGGTNVATFLSRAADVLVQSWSDIRVCEREECGRLFVPVRRQVFCSPDCSRAVQWARYLERNPDRARDYHEEYKQRVQSKFGRVKVQKRGPRSKSRRKDKAR
jgi:hypothetical protein